MAPESIKSENQEGSTTASVTGSVASGISEGGAGSVEGSLVPAALVAWAKSVRMGLIQKLNLESRRRL
jgi:hypothetical protein